MHRVMSWRARGLVGRIIPLLPLTASILDVGCGTGHNGERLRSLGVGPVTEVDIVDFSVIGPRPTLFDGRRLPFADGSYDVVTLIYVLQYPNEPATLLREAWRVCRSAVIVIQTVCDGRVGHGFHRLNEFVSRLGFCSARALRAIRAVPCPLNSAHSFSRERLLGTVREAALFPTVLKAERHVHLPFLSRITCRLEALKRTEL